MKSLQIPVGPNATVDGGPFENFEADPIASVTGVLVGQDGHEVDLMELEDGLSSEMHEDEPIRFSTGDVGEDPSTGEDVTLGYIRLPLRAGYAVEVFDLGPSSDNRHLLPNLTQFQRRQPVEKALERHGGVVEPT